MAECRLYQADRCATVQRMARMRMAQPVWAYLCRQACSVGGGIHEAGDLGRKRPTAGVVVRGAVRVVAAVATRLATFDAAALQLREVERWRQVRQALETRHEARRAQRRFRRDPTAYLAQFEARLLQ